MFEMDVLSIPFRGATRAARAPKPGKTPIMAACCCLLFSKIKVRPRSCRSYPISRPCRSHTIITSPDSDVILTPLSNTVI